MASRTSMAKYDSIGHSSLKRQKKRKKKEKNLQISVDEEKFQFWKMELNVIVGHKIRKMRESLSSSSSRTG